MVVAFKGILQTVRSMERIMKRLFGLLLAGLISGLVYAEDLPITIQDLSGGEMNQYDSMLIPDNSVYEARNVYFDADSMVKKRKGMAKLNTAAIGDSGSIYNQFEFKKSNGTNYHIVCSSNTLYYRTSGPTFTAFLANYSTSTSIANFEVFMDTLQFCNGNANLQYWDTSKVATTIATYQPKYLLAWQNRLWMAGDTDEPSTLRSCEWLNPFDWTIPTSNAVATDPVLFDINSQDGQKIMGIKKSPNGYLLVLKEKSCWEVGGVDRDDFSLRLVSPDLGCMDQGSFAYKEGRATWLSSEGFVEYDGNTIRIISKPIQTTVDSIKQLSVGRGSFVKNSPTEWGVYSSTSFVDITSVPGSMKNTLTISATYQYYNETQAVGGAVKIGTNKHIAIRNHSDGIWSEVFTAGELTSRTKIQALTWGSNPDAGLPRLFNGAVDSMKVDSNDKIHLAYLLKTTGNWVIAYTTSTDGVTWSTAETMGDLGWSTMNGFDASTIFQCVLDLDSNNSANIIVSSVTKSYTSTLHYYYRTTSWQDGGTVGSAARWYFDMAIDSENHLNIVAESPSGYSSIYYIHATTGSSSGYTDTDTTIDGSVSGIALTSSDKVYASIHLGIVTNNSGSWVKTSLTDYAVPSTVKINSSNKIFLVGQDAHFGEFNPNTSTIKSYTFDTVSHSWPSLFIDKYDNPVIMYSNPGTGTYPYASKIWTSTGTYVSEVFDTSYASGITFDTFTTQETDNDYNVKHYVRSNASSTSILTGAWTQFTRNQTPSLSASRYMQYKCDISTNVISNLTPSVDEVNIAYYSTSGSNRLSSLYYDQRVYNAVSVSSGSVLDRMIVYDSNNKWTELTSGINCINVYNFNGIPYFGSDNGFIYQMDIGTDDSGSNIDAYILTKSYALGAIYQKNLSKLFVLADDSGNWNLNLSYYLDRSATANETFAIDLDQTAGLINYKVPLLKNTPFGTIQFKFSNGNANQPFDMYGVYGFYRIQPLR
jgi:hypothetical protein